MFDQPGQPALERVVELLDRYHRLLALVAGAARPVAETALHPMLVVPLIVAAVDGPATATGTLATAATMAWLLPRVLVAQVGRRGWLLAARALVAGLIALALLLWGGSANGLMSGLLILLTAFWAIGGLLAADQPAGLSGLSDEEIADRQAGLLVGGGLAVLTGLLASSLLGPDGAGFPGWAAQLALLAALALAVAAALAWRGQAATLVGGAAPWADLPLLPALLIHGRRPRRYIAFRAVLAVSMLADPLLIVYALRAFDLPIQGAGLVLALFALIQLVAGLVLPSVMAAGYARLLTQATALARVLLPLLTLALPLILSAGPVASRLPADAAWLAPAAFLAVAALYGLATAGAAAADTAYFSDALAPVHRPAMRALLMIVLAITSLAFIAGGTIADRWGMEALLLVATAAGLATLLASGLLLDVPPAETRDLTDTGALPTFREQRD